MEPKYNKNNYNKFYNKTIILMLVGAIFTLIAPLIRHFTPISVELYEVLRPLIITSFLLILISQIILCSIIFMRDADVYKQINPDDKVFTKRVLKKIRKIEMKFDIAASIMVVGIFVYGFTMLGL